MELMPGLLKLVYFMRTKSKFVLQEAYIMKKIVTIVCLSAIFTTSFAMTSVNLDEHNFTCNQVKLTNNSSESEITLNCNKVKSFYKKNGIEGRNPSRVSGGGADITQMTAPDQEISLHKMRFYDDEDQELICNFEDGKIHKCKVELKKSNQDKQEELK